jgi:hypothetical protein
MIDEKIMVIYHPVLGDGWTLIETDKGIYQIRVGTIQKIYSVDFEKYEIISNPKNGIRIIGLWTDSVVVYIELEDNSFVTIGFLDIDSDGNMHAGVYFDEKEELDEDERDFENDPNLTRIEIIR